MGINNPPTKNKMSMMSFDEICAATTSKIQRYFSKDPITNGNIKLHSEGDCMRYLQHAVGIAMNGNVSVNAYAANVLAKDCTELYCEIFFFGEKMKGYAIKTTLTNTGNNRWEMIATLVER